jgi:hypothetical protein
MRTIIPLCDLESREVVSLVITAIMLLLFALFWALAIFYLIRFDTRREPILHQWAARNRCRILDWEERYFFKGPYFWTNFWFAWSRPAVFYVAVEDTHGIPRHCWVRWGSWLAGIFSDKIEVVWEENGLQPRT